MTEFVATIIAIIIIITPFVALYFLVKKAMAYLKQRREGGNRTAQVKKQLIEMSPELSKKKEERKQAIKGTVSLAFLIVLFFLSYNALSNQSSEQSKTQSSAGETQQEKTKLSEQELEKAVSKAVWEMTPDQFPRVYEQWGADWVDKLNAMQYEAARKVAQAPSCDSISIIGLSESRSVPKQSAVFFADCANGERFYVSDEDLQNNQAIQSKQEQMSDLTDSKAIEQCENAIMTQLTHPSSFSHTWLGQDVYRPATGNVVATIDFEAKNALGLDIPMSARCVFDDIGMSPPVITNR